MWVRVGKKLVKSDKSNFFFVKLYFLAVLNFFPDFWPFLKLQKMKFGFKKFPWNRFFFLIHEFFCPGVFYIFWPTMILHNTTYMNVHKCETNFASLFTHLSVVGWPKWWCCWLYCCCCVYVSCLASVRWTKHLLLRTPSSSEYHDFACTQQWHLASGILLHFLTLNSKKVIILYSSNWVESLSLRRFVAQ